MSTSLAPAAGSTITVSRKPVVPAAARASRARRHRIAEVVVGLAVPVIGLALWQVAVDVGWVDGRLYPAPWSTVTAVRELATDGGLGSDLLATTQRLLVGYVLGTAVGVALGAATGLSRWARAGLEPTLNAFFVVPKLALLPIFITMFGFGDGPIVVLIAVSVFLFVWVNTMEAICAVPAGYRDAARSFGVTRAQMFRHVLWPAALPQVFVGLRIAMSVSVIIVIAAEFVLGNSGLGELIFSSRQLFLNTWVYAGIATVALEGMALAMLVDRLGRRVMPWAPHDRRRPTL